VPMTGIWHYPAIVTDTTIATPVLDFVDDNGAVLATAAVEVTTATGREMHIFMDQGSWSLSSNVWEHIQGI